MVAITVAAVGLTIRERHEICAAAAADAHWPVLSAARSDSDAVRCSSFRGRFVRGTDAHKKSGPVHADGSGLL